MNVPKDPIILASFINTKLRDEFQTLESACENLDIDKQELVDKLIEYQKFKKLSNLMEEKEEESEEEDEEYVDYWLDLLKQAMQGKEVFEFADSRARFIPNTPPGLTTGRINLKVPLAEERVQEIAEWHGLIIEFDDDVTVALHGDKSDLQMGLKEMGSFFLEE